jgi:RNA polymerase sigma-70 factor (ECF subfamily)
MRYRFSAQGEVTGGRIKDCLWIPSLDSPVTKPTEQNLLHKGAQQGQGGPRPHQDDYSSLLRAVQSGSNQAMERLLMRAQEVAYRFSQVVCGHGADADDAMQEALLKTYRYATRIREPEAFKTWLYRTVKNACLIGRRRKVHEPAQLLSLDDVVPSPDGDRRGIEAVDQGRKPDEHAINLALRRRLRKAIAALPASYRMVVFLREMEGLTTRQVAQVTGISEANVKTRLHRARLFLRQELERQ